MSYVPLSSVSILSQANLSSLDPKLMDQFPYGYNYVAFDKLPPMCPEGQLCVATLFLYRSGMSETREDKSQTAEPSCTGTMYELVLTR